MISLFYATFYQHINSFEIIQFFCTLLDGFIDLNQQVKRTCTVFFQIAVKVWPNLFVLETLC